jgi:dynein heavy chain
MKVTEEEWTEQVLAFEHYKKRGPMYLDKAFTERLLEQLEDSQALLANILTSKYIAPLRTETASLAVLLISVILRHIVYHVNYCETVKNPKKLVPYI